MRTPYVSVVMTSYNREKYIGQAIDSILAQECKFPFEIIIGDDSTKRNTRTSLSLISMRPIKDLEPIGHRHANLHEVSTLPSVMTMIIGVNQHICNPLQTIWMRTKTVV